MADSSPFFFFAVVIFVGMPSSFSYHHPLLLGMLNTVLEGNAEHPSLSDCLPCFPCVPQKGRDGHLFLFSFKNGVSCPRRGVYTYTLRSRHKLHVAASGSPVLTDFSVRGYFGGQKVALIWGLN